MNAVNKLMDSAQEIACNRKIPCNIVDWAGNLYDKLNNQHDLDNFISVRDLVLLSLYSDDESKSLYTISHDLLSRM